jgi:hypothetical protein
MYNTTFGKNLIGGVIPSQVAKEADMRSWLESNDFRNLPDCDGQLWHLDLKLRELPEASKKRMIISVLLSLKGVFSAVDFLRAGVMRLPQDQRLKELLGDDTQTYLLGNWTFTAESLEEAKSELHDSIGQICGFLNNEGLSDKKRLMISKYLDRSAVFGF